MIRRVFAFLLALVMVLMVQTGCTVTQKPDSGGKTDPVSSTTKAPEENFNKVGYPIVNEKIKVTGMHPAHSVEGDAKGMSYWDKLEEVTNMEIEWIRVPPDANAIELYYAAGDFPDFFHSTVDVDKQMTYGVEGGMFLDISKLMYDLMPNMVSWFKEYPDAEKAIRQINGEVYTLPRIQKASTSASGQMFYRTDYLENLGLKTPATTDEFYETLVALDESGLTQGYAVLLPYNLGHFNNQTEVFMFPAFGESTEPDFGDDGTGKVTYNRISEQYRRYLEYMNKLYKEGLLENEVFTIDPATTMARVKAGQAAFMSAAHNLIEEDFPDGKIHLDCLAPLTSEFTSTKKVMAYPFISSYGGTITKKSKYGKELLRMFDINYAREEVVPGSGLYGVSQAIGLEGKDWEYTKEDKSAYALIAMPDDWKESIWDYYTNHVAWNQYFSAHIMVSTSGTGNNLARELGMLNNNIPYGVPRFPDALMKYTADEKNEIANRQNDIQTYVLQARAQFITGIEPLSNWDKYVAEVKAMGIDELLKVKQTAYDRWNGK